MIANTASGDVEIAVGRLRRASANTASGDTTIGAVVSGSVVVNAASGDVRIGVRRGSRVHLDCSTVSGDARSELELGTDEPEGDGPFVEVKARTASGDITITRAPAPAERTGGARMNRLSWDSTAPRRLSASAASGGAATTRSITAEAELIRPHHGHLRRVWPFG